MCLPVLAAPIQRSLSDVYGRSGYSIRGSLMPHRAKRSGAYECYLNDQPCATCTAPNNCCIYNANGTCSCGMC